MSDHADAHRSWVLFGVRTSLAPDIAEIVWRRGERLACVVDNLPDQFPYPNDLAPVLRPDQLDDEHRRMAVCIPQSTPAHRHTVAAHALASGFVEFPPLVDPTAVVARTAHLDRGVVVGAGAVVAAQASLGEFVLVNRSASVGHHALIGEYASIGPGAVLAGAVTIGRGGFIGAGAVLAPEVTVGSDAVVGAGAVVIRDVADNTVVVGNPARVLRSDVPSIAAWE